MQQFILAPYAKYQGFPCKRQEISGPAYSKIAQLIILNSLVRRHQIDFSFHIITHVLFSLVWHLLDYSLYRSLLFLDLLESQMPGSFALCVGIHHSNEFPSLL